MDFLTTDFIYPQHQVNMGTNVVLQHNVVAGYERVAYRVDGEPCAGDAARMFSACVSAVCEKKEKTPRKLTRLTFFSPARAGYLNDNEKWIHNEAHGGLYGVYLNRDGLPGCSLIQGFFVWRNFDYGIYFQV